MWLRVSAGRTVLTSLTSVWTTIVLAMSSQCHSCATLFPLSRLLAPVFPWITTSVCIPSLPHCTQSLPQYVYPHCLTVHSPPQYVYIHCLSIYTHYLCIYALPQDTQLPPQDTQLPPQYVITASVYTLTTSVYTHCLSIHNHCLSMHIITASEYTLTTSVCIYILNHHLCIYSLP